MSSSSHPGNAAPQDPMAKGLAVFSFALGIPQTLMPGRVNRLIGVKDTTTSRAIMRAVGVRELVAGVGIFTDRRPAGWIWARVAGDTMDLALLGSALRNKSKSPTRTLAATGAVAGAFAADVIDGVRLSRASEGNGNGDGPPAGEIEQPVQVTAAITVRRDRAELYALWRDFERFPDFMAHLDDVRATGTTTSHWKARGPLGMTVEWDAEIIDDVPGERIAWRSVEGSKIDNSGTVRFVDAPGDQGTELHVHMRYSPPAGAVGATIAKIFGEEPAIGLKDDLRRFKNIAETGEIVRSDGSPEGTLGRRQLKQRPAHPLPDDELAGASTNGGGS
ncbi:MAG: SRPBCC family protein [Solirubrobacteraceae bacterium]|nr:SRPBCC family protein [Solirubrobacteraceae bacterium]